MIDSAPPQLWYSPWDFWTSQPNASGQGGLLPATIKTQGARGAPLLCRLVGHLTVPLSVIGAPKHLALHYDQASCLLTFGRGFHKYKETQSTETLTFIKHNV